MSDVFKDPVVAAILHTEDEENPHNTTYDQTGAFGVENDLSELNTTTKKGNARTNLGLMLVTTLLDCVARIRVLKGGTQVGVRRGINLVEGDNVSLTVSDDPANERINVTINADETGEANTASNLGTSTDGEGLFAGKSGVDLRFKRIKAGGNVTLNSTANSIEVSASATDTSDKVDLSALKAYIEGLRVEFVSATQFRVTSGSAYIEGLGRIVDLAAGVTVTPTLSASRWYFVYLGESSGDGAIFYSTTAPAAPYRGTARSSSGSTSLRLIGCFLTNASSEIVNFLRSGDWVRYNHAGYEVASNANPGTETTLDCSDYVPPVSRRVMLELRSTATDVSLEVGNATDDMTAVTDPGLVTLLAGGDMLLADVPTNSSQEITYWYRNGVSNGVATLTIKGFWEER